MSRPEHYADIFRLRGEIHDAAMRAWPHALDEEILYLVDQLALTAGARVLDLGCAGGYLAQPVQGYGACYSGVDSSEVLVGLAQQSGLDVRLSPLSRLPFAANEFDAVVAQAGLHHEPDWSAIFAEAARVAKPGARLVVGEVAEASPVAGFLDTFVDRHNPFGHTGKYVNAAFVSAIRDAGWVLDTDTQRDYHWRCASTADLHAFITRLFYMPEIDEKILLAGIAEHLGKLQNTAIGVGMPWGMRVMCARKPGALASV